MINDLEKIWRKRRNDFCQVLKLVKTSSNNFNSIIQAWKQSNVEAEDFFDVMLSFASLQIRNFSSKSCHCDFLKSVIPRLDTGAALRKDELELILHIYIVQCCYTTI